MPQIATILQDESLNEGAHIRFYAEGIFYKVMLHSLICSVAVEPSEDFSC